MRDYMSQYEEMMVLRVQFLTNSEKNDKSYAVVIMP